MTRCQLEMHAEGDVIDEPGLETDGEGRNLDRGDLAPRQTRTWARAMKVTCGSTWRSRAGGMGEREARGKPGKERVSVCGRLQPFATTATPWEQPVLCSLASSTNTTAADNRAVLQPDSSTRCPSNSCIDPCREMLNAKEKERAKEGVLL